MKIDTLVRSQNAYMNVSNERNQRNNEGIPITRSYTAAATMVTHRDKALAAVAKRAHRRSSVPSVYENIKDVNLPNIPPRRNKIIKESMMKPKQFHVR